MPKIKLRQVFWLCPHCGAKITTIPDLNNHPCYLAHMPIPPEDRPNEYNPDNPDEGYMQISD